MLYSYLEGIVPLILSGLAHRQTLLAQNYRDHITNPLIEGYCDNGLDKGDTCRQSLYRRCDTTLGWGVLILSPREYHRDEQTYGLESIYDILYAESSYPFCGLEDMYLLSLFVAHSILYWRK